MKKGIIYLQKNMNKTLSSYSMHVLIILKKKYFWFKFEMHYLSLIVQDKAE